MPSTYKKNTPLEERKQKSKKMLAMYPNRIPVIVEMSTSSASYTTYIEASHKIKYLVPYDICLGQLIKIIRDKIKLDKTKGLFFFIQNKLLPPSSIIGEIYKDYDDEDGFLYIEFCEENTFGDYSHP
jgi:GABA(A) receptor-associated protein